MLHPLLGEQAHQRPVRSRTLARAKRWAMRACSSATVSAHRPTALTGVQLSVAIR